jgi:hypothetical protein
MENLTFENILLACCGIITHVLMMILDRRNKSLPLSAVYFFCDVNNYIRIALAFISVFALLIMSKDVMDTLGILLKNGTSATKLFSFLAGYLNHSVVRYIVKVFKK